MLPEIGFAIQITLGTVFISSACSKLREPSAFVQGVIEYNMVPKQVAYGIAVFVIFMETFLAISHLSGWMLRVALPLAICLLLSFGVAVGVNLQRGRVLPCHCFGSGGSETISRLTLARLLMLLIGEILLFAIGTPGLLIRYTYSPWGFLTLGYALLWTTFLWILARWILSSIELWRLIRPWKLYAERRGEHESPAV